MPYKRGPNNTLRFYSKSTGRHCNDPSSSNIVTKKRLSAEEKEIMRRSDLYQAAKNSKDKNLFLVYQMLESIAPGCVKHINSLFYDKESKRIREFDIITSDAMYEIKHGRSRHHIKQYVNQLKVATSLKKDHVVFTPDSSNYQIKCMRLLGIKAYNNINEFYESEKKRKCKN